MISISIYIYPNIFFFVFILYNLWTIKLIFNIISSNNRLIFIILIDISSLSFRFLISGTFIIFISIVYYVYWLSWLSHFINRIICSGRLSLISRLICLLKVYSYWPLSLPWSTRVFYLSIECFDSNPLPF